MTTLSEDFPTLVTGWSFDFPYPQIFNTSVLGPIIATRTNIYQYNPIREIPVCGFPSVNILEERITESTSIPLGSSPVRVYVKVEANIPKGGEIKINQRKVYNHSVELEGGIQYVSTNVGLFFYATDLAITIIGEGTEIKRLLVYIETPVEVQSNNNEIWEFVEYKDTFALNRGGFTYYYIGEIDGFVLFDEERTITRHRSRFISGGGTLPFSYEPYIVQHKHRSSVWWSGYELYGCRYRYTNGKVEDFLAIQLRGDSGYQIVSDIGNIIKLMEFGNGLICFGDSGIALLPAISEPMPTYGQIVYNKSLILGGRGCVCGDAKSIIFIDNKGRMWELISDGKLNYLGYKDYLKDLSLQETVMVMYENSVYISDGSKSFIYTNGKLSSFDGFITSCIVHQGTPLAIGTLNTESLVDIETVPIQFGSLGTKTLHALELYCDYPQNAMITIQSKESLDSDYTEHIFLGTTTGIVPLHVTGVEFIIKFYGNIGKVYNANIIVEIQEYFGLRGVNDGRSISQTG